MKRSKWEDHEIETLLKEMPKPASRTSTEEMYQAIQSRRARRTRRTVRVVPAFAGLAALLLLFLIVPSFLSNNTADQSGQPSSTADLGTGTTEMMTQSVEEDSGGGTENSGDGSEQADTAAENDSAEITEERNVEEEPADAVPAEDSGEQERSESSVQEEESSEDLPSALDGSGIVVANEQPVASLTLGLVTPDQFVVPVTVELPEASRNEDVADLYNRWASEVDETALGFLDVHPVRGTAEQLDDTLIFTVEEDAPLLMSDVSDGALNDVLQLLTKNNLDSVSFQNSESETVELDPFGPLTMNKVDQGPSAYYVYRVNDQPYYMAVPANGTAPSEIFAEMKSAPNDYFEPAIPEELDFAIEEEAGLLTVTIRETGEEMTAESTVQIVESMLLTAKSLGFESVLFNGLTIEEISGFKVTEPIPVPQYENRTVYP